MSDTKNTEENTLSALGRKPLTLKRRVEAGTVRQSFSHGRTKTVVVEKKRRKMLTPKDAAAAAAAVVDKEKVKKTAPAAPQPTPVQSAQASQRAGVVLRELTDEEKAARTKALEESKIVEADALRLAEQEAEQRAEEAARLATERERAGENLQEAGTELTQEEQIEAEATHLLQEEQAKQAAEEKAVKTRGKAVDSKEEEKARRARRDEQRPISARKGERRRREGKLTIVRALYDGDEDRVRSLTSMRRAREREKRAASARSGDQQKIYREVIIPEAITVEELANRMAERVVVVVRKLMDNGQMLTKNDVIDADTAELIVADFGHIAKRIAEADVELGLADDEDEAATLVARAPVVTIMGHVDHGKTSLLDALRETDVAAGEAGGITQHIGAYQVTLSSGRKITFLDTPGHAAFTAMRARGAQVTDIVVLVVAADDGVMPQTVEAIHHAKAAGVPMIIAINKIDKPDANPDRVRQDLLQHEVVTEKMGGDALDVEVSATKKMNLDKLEETILLQAELLELKVNPNRAADGAVIESRLDKGRGAVASVLVQRGTLKVGDIMVAGREWGKIRALINGKGENTNAAGPTEPVEVLGLSGTPEPGEDFVVVDSDGRAREVAEYRRRKKKQKEALTKGRSTLEQLMSQLKESAVQELPLLVKADVQGSAEAINAALEKMSTEEVAAKVIHLGVGGITESDVVLAAASNAPIIGFNVRANKQAREHAARDGVEIRYYSIIYNVIDDIKAALSGLLPPTLRETFLGNAEILEVFNVSKVGKVAGCRVTEGKVRRGAKVRLIRDSVVMHEGELSTLKRFKDEVKEVDAGQECGMAFANYQEIQVGDIIECFEVEEVARTL